MPAGGGSFNISHVTTVHALQTAYKLLNMNTRPQTCLGNRSILPTFLIPNENVLSNAMSVKLWESCICSQLLTVRLQFVVLSFGVSKSTQILIIKGNFLGLVIWWTLSSNCSISLPRGNSISKLDFSQINAYVYCLYKYFCDFTLAVESSTGKVRIKAELKPPPPALPV